MFYIGFSFGSIFLYVSFLSTLLVYLEISNAILSIVLKIIFFLFLILGILFFWFHTTNIIKLIKDNIYLIISNQKSYYLCFVNVPWKHH